MDAKTQALIDQHRQDAAAFRKAGNLHAATRHEDHADGIERRAKERAGEVDSGDGS